MALNGYVTAEERRSRLVETSRGLVVVVRQVPRPWPGVRTVPTEYAVFRDGVLIAWIWKIRKWGLSGYNSGFKTRKDAIEAALRWSAAPAEAAKAKAAYDARGVNGLDGGREG